jgi:Terminase RNaseH-like domain
MWTSTRKISPKTQKLLSVPDSVLSSERRSKIPDKWEDFARMTLIRSGTKIVNFNPYPYQIKAVESFENNFGNVVVKTRQLGMTETVANWMMWRAAKDPAFLGVVLSKTQSDTSNVARRVRASAESVPELIKLKTQNLTDLVFAGGGRILFRPSSPHAVRGIDSLSVCFLDEASFLDDLLLESIWLAAIPAMEMVGKDARIILQSTPYGRSGFFYDRFVANNGDIDIFEEIDAVRESGSSGYRHWVDNNGWAKHLIHWRAHPIYGSDENYIENICKVKQISESSARQEYDLEFATTELNIFPAEVVHACISGTWEEPTSKHPYYIACDCSSTGNDYTVAIVFKFVENKLSVVHMFRQRKRTLDYYIDSISKLIRDYQPIAVAVERNGIGAVFIEQLIKSNPQIRIEPFLTTRESKRESMTRLLFALENRLVSFPACVIADELKGFQRNGSKMEAASGQHDDTVISMAAGVSISPIKFNDSTFDLSFRKK